ncbi:hypothetical protein ACP70R_033918 [Stipagrostis hirtigluma subsp. patula]
MADEQSTDETPAARKREAATLPISMVAVQAIMVGMVLLSKLALASGMQPMVLMVYRSLIAAAAVAPLALIFEREMWKKLNWAVWGWISANAAFGLVLAMGLYYYGLQTTSASYSAIFLNMVPIVTFIIAIILRAEKLALVHWHGKMKLLGAILCVGGTLVVSILKGRLLNLWPTHLLRDTHAKAPASPGAGAHHGMVIGTLFLCGSCLGYSMWLIVQARLAKIFQSKYWATMLTCFVGSIQCFVVGVFLSHDKADWKLKWNLQLLTVVYSGVLNTGVTFVLISWAVSRRGPIYPPMFNSLSLIVAMVLDSVLLGTNIYVGSVVGTVIIVVGLYAFLWGKSEELKLTAAATLSQPMEVGRVEAASSMQAETRSDGHGLASSPIGPEAV